MLALGATDWIDGYLARRLHQVSDLGKFLDPLADRLAVATAVVGGMVTGVLPLLLGWLLIIREALVGVGALFMAARGERLEVRWLGKLATFILYGAIAAFYVAAGGWGQEFFTAIGWVFGVPGLVFYWWVAVQYFGDMRSV